jgi:hypothetical protein
MSGTAPSEKNIEQRILSRSCLGLDMGALIMIALILIIFTSLYAWSSLDKGYLMMASMFVIVGLGFVSWVVGGLSAYKVSKQQQ